MTIRGLLVNHTVFYLTVDVFGCLGEQMMDYIVMPQFSCQMQTSEAHDILG